MSLISSRASSLIGLPLAFGLFALFLSNEAPAQKAPSSVADGAKIYATYCASCHGPSGKGDGAIAVSMEPKPADLTSPAFWKGKDRATVTRAIRDGGAAVGKSPLMAAFGSILSPADLKAVVDQVESFRPKP